jgi:hypothetical protein
LTRLVTHLAQCCGGRHNPVEHPYAIG